MKSMTLKQIEKWRAVGCPPDEDEIEAIKRAVQDFEEGKGVPLHKVLADLGIEWTTVS